MHTVYPIDGLSPRLSVLRVSNAHPHARNGRSNDTAKALCAWRRYCTGIYCDDEHRYDGVVV